MRRRSGPAMPAAVASAPRNDLCRAHPTIAMPATDARLKPMGLAASLLYFSIPAAIFSASILGLLPWMIRQGYSQLTTFLVTFGGPLAAMLIAALVFYRLEGRAWNWPDFRARMRLQAPSARDWMLTVALVAVIFGGQWLIGQFVVPLFSGLHLYDAPPEFGAVMGGIQGGVFDGRPMAGRWDIFFALTLTLIVLNILGEELWWRGIILPRQELALGKWAWLVNGVLWDLFHIFYHTNVGSMVAYIPATLPLAYVAWKTRNTWPGIVAHLITNGAFVVALWKAVTA